MNNLLFLDARFNIIKFNIIFFILFCNRVIFSSYIMESIEGDKAVIIHKSNKNQKLDRISGNIIDIRNNNILIDSKNDICAIIKDKNNNENNNDKDNKFILVCKSGLIIKNICKIKYYNKPLKFLFSLKNYIGVRSVIDNLNLERTTIYYKCE